MLAMMILLTIDIISRAVAHPLQGMAELSVFVMMVVIYLGLARCEESKEHVALEFTLSYLSIPLRRRIEFMARLLAAISAGLLFYAILLNAINSYRTNESLEGTVELPIWPVKFIMVIGLVFFAMQTLIHLMEKAQNFIGPKKGDKNSEQIMKDTGEKIY